MSYLISFTECSDLFVCKDHENVLEGMSRLGKRGIPKGCCGGACGVCKVAVVDGEYSAKKMSSCHISSEDLAENVVLACRIYPQSDLKLSVIGPMKKNVTK